MKAEHEAEMTFDRISTREELCEVIDLLCDTGYAIPAGVSRKGRRAGSDPNSAELLAADLALEPDDEDDDQGVEEPDELSATLGELFAGASWLN